MGKTGRMAWIVWTVGVFAYAVAIMQRTSLGVLGEPTSQHFNSSVGIISSFVMVQLATYAFAQLPAGVLIDRYGPRILMVAGSAVLIAAQVIMAFAATLPLAFAARILLGLGDACLFGSALRLIPAWFPASRVPVLSQLTGLLGQMGQVASVTLLLPLHTAYGWTLTFLVAAGFSVAATLASLLWVHDVPPGNQRPTPPEEKLSDLPKGIAVAWQHPATRLGFWVHLASGFSVNVFAMIWGLPWLMNAQGRSQAEAAFLFSLTALVSVGFAPLLGWLTARHPLRRSNLALTVIWAHLICWSLVLLWPGTAPWWLLVVLMVIMAAGGPGTGVGFDYPRTLLSAERLGAANGIVITGSFTGATLCLVAIGTLLAVIAPSGQYSAAQLDLALAVQLPFFAAGIIGIHVTRHQLRTKMRAHGVIVPTWREVARRYRKRQNSPSGSGGGA